MRSKNRFHAKRLMDIVIGKLFFNILRKQKKDFPKKFNKILIYKLSAIGDSILLLPSVKNLREKTGAKIVMVHSSDNKVVFQNQSFIDKRIEIDVAKNNFFKIIKNLFNLRKEKADLAIDFSNTGYFSAVFAKLTAKYSVGFFNKEIPNRKNFFDKEFSLDLNKHTVINYLNLVGIAINKKVSTPNLIPIKSSPKDKLFVKNLLKNKKNLVGIHPCHEIKKKSWEEKKFVKIINFLIKNKKIPVILGSPKEKFAVEQLLKKVNEKKVINLTGKMSIPQVSAAMDYFDFFISNDGGIMHISASKNLKTLGIFNIESPKRYSPFNKKSFSVHKNTISVEEVKEILEKYFL